MKEFKILIHGNPYNVTVAESGDNKAEVSVNGTDYTVEIEGLKSKPAPRRAPVASRVAAPTTAPVVASSVAAPASGSGTSVKSPLPGTILEVSVREGDTVKVGQRLLLLEAMKMENNIDAEVAGVVSSIKVRQGDAVLEGQVLITIG